MDDFEFADAEIDAAISRGSSARAARPAPTSARYDPPSGRVVIEFANGAAFMVPARSLQGLSEATDEELSQIEILGEDGLRWESLDADFTIAGLMTGIFGTARFMGDMQRQGGRSRTAAKTAAARENGRKGGRPRKVV